jgi:hypothetical protein
MRETPAGIRVALLHYSACPEMTGPRLEHERAKYSSDAYWRQEMEMEAHALEGQRVYDGFDPAIHVIADAIVPKRGCRFMAIDPHPRTPHAFLWVLIDPWGDWYVYRELWPSQVYGAGRDLRDTDSENAYTVREYAETLAALEGNRIEWLNAERDDEYGIYREKPGGERVLYRFMDQAGKGFQASDESADLESYARRYDRCGIQCSDPMREHRSGEDAVRELLKLRAHDRFGLWPRLHLAASCIEVQLELTRHRYRMLRTWTGSRELRQEGVEARCHLIDCLRYLATGRLFYQESLSS